MQTTINGVRIMYSDSNCCHKTLDDLVCSVCGKKTDRVYVVRSNMYKTALRFACYKPSCFSILLNEMFVEYDDEHLDVCSITDIRYVKKRETKRRIRSEMTLRLRYSIMKRDNFMCVLCGRRPPEVELHVDHIKPVSKGGTNDESNLRTLCADCNMGKGGE